MVVGSQRGGMRAKKNLRMDLLLLIRKDLQPAGGGSRLGSATIAPSNGPIFTPAPSNVRENVATPVRISPPARVGGSDTINQ